MCTFLLPLFYVKANIYSLLHFAFLLKIISWKITPYQFSKIFLILFLQMHKTPLYVFTIIYPTNLLHLDILEMSNILELQIMLQ